MKSPTKVCKYCGGICIKKGKRNGKQRFQCKHCEKYQLSYYSKNRIPESKEELLAKLNNEGMGISSISRILHVSKSSVQRIIIKFSKAVLKPLISERNQVYEIDELRTFERNKKNESWVIYAINKANGNVINLVVGRRTKENIKKVVDMVLSLNPAKIYTDGLNVYRSLIPKSIHRVFKFCTNKIERNNLTLRTHMKRLNRKTICFTKSNLMLEACLSLYIWRSYNAV